MKFWSECVLCCLLAKGVRRCGAAALDLAWTACGRFDAFYEDELKPWDMAAGALLVTEAGGSISNLDGSPFDLRWSILAGNKAMHELIGKNDPVIQVRNKERRPEPDNGAPLRP